MTLSSLLSNAAKMISTHSPVILTAISITGTVTTAVLAGKASFEASEMLRREPPNQPFKDKAKIVWTLYIPAVGTGAITIGCMLGATHIGTKRAAAMAAFASLSEKALVEYKDKVAERIGASQEEKLRGEIAQERLDRNPVSSQSVIVTDTGTALCYDSITGRYFQSSVQALRSAENKLNHILNHNMYASLNEFFELIGLPPTPYAGEIGWNANELLELRFATVLSDDGRPCISLEYAVWPVRKYTSTWQ